MMAARPTLNVSLTWSGDWRGVTSYTNMIAGKDQRRLNCQYEVTRVAVNTPQDISISRRPGGTIYAGTYGSGTQVQYLVARDPAGTWNPTAWVLSKDGNNSTAASSSTTTTILNSADYYPRFWSTTDVSGTNTLVVQLQNSASPSAAPAQKVYYSTAIATFTEISDADFTALSQRGQMVFMDGYAFILDSRNRIYQSNINSLSAWTSTDYLTMSTTTAPPQGLIKIKNIICAFTTEYCELFQNEGNATGSVLSRIAKSETGIGLASVAGGGSSIASKTFYAQTLGEWVFFLGRYAGSKNDCSLVAFNGARFDKITKPHEDTLLSSTTIYGLHKGSWNGKPFVAVQFTAPSETTERGWLYFPDINEGFEYSSPIVGLANNALHYRGCSAVQKLYTFEAANTYQDDGTSFDMIIQFKLPFGDLSPKSMSMFGFIGDTSATSQTISVSFSKDNGQNWSTARTFDMNSMRKEIRRLQLGYFKELMVRILHAGDGEVRFRRVYGDPR